MTWTIGAWEMVRVGVALLLEEVVGGEEAADGPTAAARPIAVRGIGEGTVAAGLVATPEVAPDRTVRGGGIAATDITTVTVKGDVTGTTTIVTDVIAAGEDLPVAIAAKAEAVPLVNVTVAVQCLPTVPDLVSGQEVKKLEKVVAGEGEEGVTAA